MRLTKLHFPEIFYAGTEKTSAQKNLINLLSNAQLLPEINQ